MKQMTINDLFRQKKEDWLEQARATARNILATKQTVTIEDVLETCPRPTYLHRNTTGSVFHADDFTPLGYTQSRRNVSHGRVIRVWGLKDQYAQH